jgi:hypothetical protein
MRILANDPGGKPGYALLDCTTCVPRKYMHRALPPLPVVLGMWPAMPSPAPAGVSVCVTELQWLYSLQKRNAILTLAPRAGWQLAVMCLCTGGTPHAQLPHDWRATLRVPESTTKEVVAARVERSLTPAETGLVGMLRLTPKRLLDIYDAIAIGWADYLDPRPWVIPP